MDLTKAKIPPVGGSIDDFSCLKSGLQVGVEHSDWFSLSPVVQLPAMLKHHLFSGSLEIATRPPPGHTYNLKVLLPQGQN